MTFPSFSSLFRSWEARLLVIFSFFATWLVDVGVFRSWRIFVVWVG